MKHLLLGAGLFGKSLAIRLVELGSEVILIDHIEDTLNGVKDLVTAAIVAETTDKDTLTEIQKKYNIQHAVICFGESFDATMLAVVYLKDMGIDDIVARASNNMQREILKKLGVKTIVLPETMMGMKIADGIILGESEQLTLDRDNTIARIRIPKEIFGKNLSEIKVDKFGIKTLFIHREYIQHKVSKLIPPDENPKLEEGDNIVLLGSPRRIAKFVNNINK